MCLDLDLSWPYSSRNRGAFLEECCLIMLLAIVSFASKAWMSLLGFVHFWK